MQAVKSKLAALHAKHQESIKAAEDEESKLNEIISQAEALEALVSVFLNYFFVVDVTVVVVLTSFLSVFFAASLVQLVTIFDGPNLDFM